MKSNYYILLLVFLNIACFNLYSQEATNSLIYPEKFINRKLRLGISPAISSPIIGTKYWNKNFGTYYGGTVYYKFIIKNKLSFGPILTFNHWVKNEERMTDFDTEYIWNIKGAIDMGDASIMCRYSLVREFKKTEFYLQGGAGYRYIKGFFKINGTKQIDDNTQAYKKNEKEFEFYNPGLNFGFGIRSGRLEMFPSYNIVFTKEQPTQYVNINIGLVF